MGGAPPADPPVDVPVCGRGDEVVVLAGPELHPSRSRRERPERDGEVHQLVRFGALSNDTRVWIDDAAGVVLLLVDAVDDVGLDGLRPRPPLVERADDVDLVVLPGLVSPVHVDDVVGVVYSKDGVARVPVDVVVLPDRHTRRDNTVQGE